MPNEKTAALILAGGLSSRMGQNKALLSLEGQTLLERAIRFWQDSCKVDRIYISCGTSLCFSDLPEGVTAVPDLLERRGPMGGLHAAFHQTDAELLWVSGVDMPFLSREAILPPPQKDAIVYRRDNGRPEPLFGVYRRSTLPVIDALLEQGCNKLRLLLEQVETEYVPLPPKFASVFLNLNTPEDYKNATKRV